MSRLVNYGTGELIDRISVLSLKIRFSHFVGLDTTHWRNERSVLLVQLGARNACQRWFELSQDLGAIHAALWQAEDELRGYRRQELADPGLVSQTSVTVCAFRIQELNDQRATLVQAINQACGDGDTHDKVDR